MDEQDVYNKAVEAYYRWCQRHNFIPQQPAWSLSDVLHTAGNKDMIIDLANVSGPLASYRYITKTNRLKRLDPINA